MNGMRALEEFLEGHYDVESEHETGAQGTIFKARVAKGGDLVAVKWMMLGNDAARERVDRIQRLAVPLVHPNVVRHYGVTVKEPHGALIMEWLEGMTVRRCITSGAFPRHELARILHRAVRGMVAMHDAGLLHRDLKSDNIQVVRGADGDLQPKLVDLGLLTCVDGRICDVTVAAVGTPLYAAPEQLANMRSEISHKADCYAIGVLLYEAFAGQLPFQASSVQELWTKIETGHYLRPRSVCPDMPSEVAALIADLLRMDPAARPDGEEILARLLPATRPEAWGDAITPPAPAPAPTTKPTKSRRTLVWGAALASFAVLVGSAVGNGLGDVGATPPKEPVKQVTPPPPTPGDGLPVATPLRTLRLLYHDVSASEAPAVIADAADVYGESLFARNGIALERVPLARGRDKQLAALAAGDADVTPMALSHFIEALPDPQTSGAYRVLFFASFVDYDLMVRPGVDVAALGGDALRLGFTARTPSEMLMRRALAEVLPAERIGPLLARAATDGPSSTKQAARMFADGQLDAVPLWPLEASRARREGACALVSERLPIVLVARAELVEQQPALVHAFARAWFEGVARIEADRTRAEEVLRAKMAWTPEDAEAVLRGTHLATFAHTRELVGVGRQHRRRHFDDLVSAVQRALRAKDPARASPLDAARELVPMQLVEALQSDYPDARLDEPKLAESLVGPLASDGPPRVFPYALGADELDLAQPLIAQSVWALTDLLHRHPDAIVQLLGSTDTGLRGDRARDLALGERRASRFAALLRDHRIEPWRIQHASVGSRGQPARGAVGQRCVTATVLRPQKPPLAAGDCSAR
ncbi:MAG: protein kinase [Polyangiales bacterium]